MAKKWEDGKVPLSYQIQCYHDTSVMNADAWYIAVLMYGRDFKFCKIERDEKILADLIRIEQELKLYLGEAEAAENERYRVSWKNVESIRVDAKRLKEEKTEIYQQYSSLSQSLSRQMKEHGITADRLLNDGSDI